MKTDLSGITFIIPLQIDTPDRLRNIILVLDYLNTYLSTSFMVAEYDNTPKFSMSETGAIENCRHVFIKTEDRNFWKTKVMNIAVEKIDTPCFVLQDADVVIEPVYLEKAYRLLLEENVDFVFPFRNDVMWIPEEVVARFDNIRLHHLHQWNYETASGRDEEYIFVGLCNFIKTESFRHIGKFNQNIRSWGFEDVELYERARKLGLNIRRLDNIPYHLGHRRTGNSNAENSYFKRNKEQYELTRGLSREELVKIIQKWNW